MWILDIMYADKDTREKIGFLKFENILDFLASQNENNIMNLKIYIRKGDKQL